MVRHIYFTAGAVLLIMFSVGAAQEDFCQQHSFYTLGDANGDSSITEADIIYLANYLFRSGAEPVPSKKSADINRDGRITLGDVVRVLNVWLGRSGVTMRLEYQNLCCNKTRCEYYCDSGSCQMTYPLSDGRVRVFIEDTLISNNFTDSSGMVSIVVPGGIYFLTILSPHDWIDSLWLIVPAGGVDLGTKSFLERFDEKEILLVYDTKYGWDRLQEIFDSIGVVYWEHFIPNFPQFIAAVAPSCLHVTEAVQFLNKHIEIVGADPGYYGCLDVKWKQFTLSLGLLTYVTTSVYLPSN